MYAVKQPSDRDARDRMQRSWNPTTQRLARQRQHGPAVLRSGFRLARGVRGNRVEIARGSYQEERQNRKGESVLASDDGISRDRERRQHHRERDVEVAATERSTDASTPQRGDHEEDSSAHQHGNRR